MKSWNAPIRLRGCLVIIALAVGLYKDEWGRPFQYESGEDGYLLASLGKDGEADFDRTATTLPIEQARFEADIVIRNGRFVQHPAAVVLP